MTDRSFSNPHRRDFLKAAVAAPAAGAVFSQFLSRVAAGADKRHAASLANLRPVADKTTGLELLQLPDGFRYASFGWTGEPMSDGRKTPSAHDGMAVIGSEGSVVTLCRNHEITGSKLIGASSISFDAKAGAGCTNLTFDTETGQWLSARSSLSGTVRNCAGGPTPWGTWLSCEETTLGPGDTINGVPVPFEETHGWIFEVPATGDATANPLKDMGRFVHEAVAVDPDTGIVYETEDRTTAGFYRFIPNSKSKLADGGKLQMLKIAGRAQLQKNCRLGEKLDVQWVDIDDPHRAHSPGKKDDLGVYSQGITQGGTTFARLEGCWYGRETGSGLIYVVSTSGGNAGAGQVWEFSPQEQTIKLIFESPAKAVMEAPDNVTIRPGSGSIVLCEDGNLSPQRLHAIRPDGSHLTIAANHVMPDPYKKRIKRDYRDGEWCGACFDPTGRWLFVNIQSPGITFAITGPWQDLKL